MSDLKLLLELLKVKDDPKFMEIMAIVQQTVDDNDKITPTQIKAIIKDLTKAEPIIRTTQKGSVCPTCGGKGWV